MASIQPIRARWDQEAEGLSRDDPILTILSWWHNSGLFLHTGRVWRTDQDLARVLMRDVELQGGYLVYGKIQPRELEMMSDGNMELRMRTKVRLKR